MIRPLEIAILTATVLLPTTLMPAPAQAQKNFSCSFEMSSPQLNALPGGAIGVTSTVKPIKCEGFASPTKSMVCVSKPGGDPPVCNTAYAWLTARAFLGTAPNVKVTVTGEGCYTGSERDEDAKDFICEPLKTVEARL